MLVRDKEHLQGRSSEVVLTRYRQSPVPQFCESSPKTLILAFLCGEAGNCHHSATFVTFALRLAHKATPSMSPQRVRARDLITFRQAPTHPFCMPRVLHAQESGAGEGQMGMLPGGVLPPMKIPPEPLNELLDVCGICACPSTAGVISAGSMLAGQP